MVENKLSFGVTGASYPFRLDGSGRVAVSTVDLDTEDVSHISESIQQILETPIGSRFFNHTFGSELRSLLFKPNAPETVAIHLSSVRDVLRKWEPRVQVISIDIVEQTDSLLRFIVSYLLVGAQATSTAEVVIL